MERNVGEICRTLGGRTLLLLCQELVDQVKVSSSRTARPQHVVVVQHKSERLHGSHESGLD